MHLFIVMTQMCAAKQHLLLSVSSIKEGVSHDDACVFAGGEHEFIDRPSFVYYRQPELRRADKIALLVEKNEYVPKADLANPHFEAVCEGVKKSKFIKRWAVEYYLNNA
jgi:hypothetical protein